MAKESIKLISASLDDSGGDITARGVLDHKSLCLIKVDDYQREVLPMTYKSSLPRAVAEGKRIQDVVLGMRGGDITERDGTIYLHDPVYVIDGLQRISTGLHLMRTGLKLDPRFGCQVYFNTTKEWEKDMFEILNTHAQRLNANILIRNDKDTSPSVEMLFNLCHDKNFSLYDRVCWQQRMRRQELITAVQLLKITGMLHSTFGPGLSSNWKEQIKGVNKTYALVGKNIMRGNVQTFFDVIDGSWGIKSVAFKESAPYLRSNFLMSMAEIFAHHKDFWDDNRRFQISSALRQKIRLFPVTDPQVRALASSGTTSRRLLYQLILNHINSGKRTRRLTPFKESDNSPRGVEELEEEMV